MDDEVKKNLIDSAFGKAEQYLPGEIKSLNNPLTGAIAPVYISGDGIEAIPASCFDGYRTQPDFRDDTATLEDLDSLIAYANRFKGDQSAMFARRSRSAPSLTAVIDYHPEGFSSEPAFGNHRGTFQFPLSEDWKAWQGENGKQMSPVEFAAFLEDHIISVLSPDHISIAEDDEETQRFFNMMGGASRLADPAKLLEIASNLQIHENSSVTQAHSLASGEAAIEFNSEHEASSKGQTITMPKMFAIGIPVFENGAAYRLFARLRYRKSGPAVVFWYDLWRTDRVFLHAFDEAVAKAVSETSLPVFLGSDR